MSSNFCQSAIMRFLVVTTYISVILAGDKKVRLKDDNYHFFRRGLFYDRSTHWAVHVCIYPPCNKPKHAESISSECTECNCDLPCWSQLRKELTFY